MRLHCHAADCHGSTETAMRLHCHAATAIALPVQPTVSHTDEPEHRDRNATALPCSDCHRIASAADCLAHRRAGEHRDRNATALPCSRLPWQRRDRNATALSCSDCHRIASAADCLAHRRAGAPRPQCDCTAMQPTAMAAPRPQCDCTVMQRLPSHCQCSRLSRTPTSRSTETAMRLHCHVADCHGSTETAMRLHCHAATAIALPVQPTVSHTDEPEHRDRNATVMQPTAMAAPRPQCDCTAMQ